MMKTEILVLVQSSLTSKFERTQELCIGNIIVKSTRKARNI